MQFWNCPKMDANVGLITAILRIPGLNWWAFHGSAFPNSLPPWTRHRHNIRAVASSSRSRCKVSAKSSKASAQLCETKVLAMQNKSADFPHRSERTTWSFRTTGFRVETEVSDWTKSAPQGAPGRHQDPQSKGNNWLTIFPPQKPPNTP